MINVSWKLTSSFLLAIFLIVIIALVFNFLVFGYFLFHDRTSNLYYQGNFFAESKSPETFIRDYKKYIRFNEAEMSFKITKEGLLELQKKDGWLQIIDEEGYELYSINRPEGAAMHYTPINLIQMHKYSGGLEGYTVFISDLPTNNNSLSYLIGFPKKYISKVNFYFSPSNLPGILKSGFLICGLLNSIIIVIIGYFFAKRLTSPIKKVTNGIQRLAQGDYQLQLKETGLYKDIYNNLNRLAQTLSLNVKQRNLVEKKREEWVSNITHDIKTPLASITGYAEILLDADYQFTDEERKKYIGIMMSKSRYIQELVADLNLTTHLNNGLISLDKESVNIVEFVRNIIIDILNDPLYQEYHIELVSTEEMITLDIDKKLIKRALVNLIYNGLIHNNHQTKLEVKIYGGEAVKILISDNGQGISGDEIKQIFQRFYRGTNTGEMHKGSGLGMAISKQIIEAHGGQITIDSEINQGTKITIVI